MTVWYYRGLTLASAVASGNITLTEPAGAQPGDLLTATIGYRGNAAFTVPAGWTKIAEENTGDTVVGAGAIASIVKAYIIRGASAPSFVFTRTGGDVAQGGVSCYEGVSPITPLDTFSQNTLAVASATVTTPSLTVSNDDALLEAGMCSPGTGAGGTFLAATSPTSPSTTEEQQPTTPLRDGWTERQDQQTSTGADQDLVIADALKVAAGATGQIQATTTVSAGRSAMIAVAFNPLSVGLVGVAVSKLTGYAVTGPQPAEMAIHKLTGYTVNGPPVGHISLSKLTGYGVAGPPADHVSVAKLTGYAVMDTSLPDYTPPVVGGRKRSQNVRYVP